MVKPLKIFGYFHPETLGKMIQFGEHIFKMDSYCQGYITKDSYTVLVEVLGMWFKPGIEPPLSFFKINPQNPPPRFRNPEPPTSRFPWCPRFLAGIPAGHQWTTFAQWSRAWLFEILLSGPLVLGAMSKKFLVQTLVVFLPGRWLS